MRQIKPLHTALEGVMGNNNKWAYTYIILSSLIEFLVLTQRLTLENFTMSSPPLMVNIGPPQKWPICFAAHILATLPALTMHNRYIRHKQSGCVKFRGGGAVYMPLLTILAPFRTNMAGKWDFPKLAPILPLSRNKAPLAWWFGAAESDLEKWLGKMCSVVDPVTTGCGCKNGKCNTSTTHACLQARPSLRVSGNLRWSKIWNVADWG